MHKSLRLGLIVLLLATTCQVTGGEPLPLTVPWGDQEETVYSIRDQQGNEVGTGMWMIRRTEDVYELQATFVLGEIKDEISLSMRASDLKPLRGERALSGTANDFTLHTTYTDDRLHISAQTRDGEKSANLRVSADAYDNDQLLVILRALPYSDDYVARFTTVVPTNGSQITTKLKVLGREMVETPAGTFEAYQVELNFVSTKQWVWYAVEAPHYMVKYDNGMTVFLLVEARP
ncbi:MAG: DUF3108 domain-containing protein [Chloroflexi bacterium]|nr:DUF3108 domain-containing protein [Chloroflexota bacterium]